ncbi:MAG TPA: imidazole glycerol phosphate synthase subunit HisH [Acidimicrobiales bacterium]|nr:imidazole glycerol phosphate synthase subunit HisH [Acidimicrobiales bacterium]
MIAVLDYGIGNLRSAQKALQRASGASGAFGESGASGAEVRLVTDAAGAEGARAVVLPGVGAFGRCMEALRDSGLDVVAKDAISAGVPFLGICVGMQMLYEGSEEDPGTAGLGILPGRVRRLPEGVKHPQMQWNRLRLLTPGDPLLAGIAEGDWAYFVHSYCAPVDDHVIATVDYGGDVAAAVATGSLWATQFHPEKSGAVGLRMLGNFAALAMRADARPRS